MFKICVLCDLCWLSWSQDNRYLIAVHFMWNHGSGCSWVVIGYQEIENIEYVDTLADVLLEFVWLPWVHSWIFPGNNAEFQVISQWIHKFEIALALCIKYCPAISGSVVTIHDLLKSCFKNRFSPSSDTRTRTILLQGCAFWLLVA